MQFSDLGFAAPQLNGQLCVDIQQRLNIEYTEYWTSDYYGKTNVMSNGKSFYEQNITVFSNSVP